MKWKEIFSEDGALSCMRYCVIFSITAIIVTWSVLCGVMKAFLDFPVGVRWVLGIMISGKVVQKALENIWSTTSDPTNSTPKTP